MTRTTRNIITAMTLATITTATMLLLMEVDQNVLHDVGARGKASQKESAAGVALSQGAQQEDAVLAETRVPDSFYAVQSVGRSVHTYIHETYRSTDKQIKRQTDIVVTHCELDMLPSQLSVALSEIASNPRVPSTTVCTLLFASTSAKLIM